MSGKQTRHSNPHCPTFHASKQTAEKRANKYGNEGSGLNQCVATHQLIFVQVLRQDGVLDGTKQG